MQTNNIDHIQTIGLLGLGVMGSNFALNMRDQGARVLAFDKTLKESPGEGIELCPDLNALVQGLERPRSILMLVPAGKAVEEALEELRSLLEPGDIIVDGGNSHYLDSERRFHECKQNGFRYLAMGVSGGAQGARRGPSLMPGGDESAYNELRPLLEKTAARTPDARPCITFLGQGGAGHFVKMIHNGIEYGDMQLIAETYDIMRNIFGFAPARIARVFESWNRGKLESYLIEISARVLNTQDRESGVPLVDLILDRAGQKGTGRWTISAALELGVAVPTLSAAVDARVLSGQKSIRLRGEALLDPGNNISKNEANNIGEKTENDLIRRLEKALYAAKIIAYSQGIELLKSGARTYKYDYSISAIARVWRAGCIIRASLLEELAKIYDEPEAPEHTLFASGFARELSECISDLRETVLLAQSGGRPLPALSSALFYYDALRAARLPADLIQGQRDFFGAHGFERTDKPGVFHGDW